MPLDLDLSRAVVLVTGANGGIGISTVEAFLDQGAEVVAQYRSSDAELVSLAGRHPLASRLQTVKADLSVEADVFRLFEEVKKPVTKLVVNHAVYDNEDMLVRDMTLDRWTKTLTSNLTSSFLVIRSFLRQLPPSWAVSPPADSKSASIVLIGSTAGRFGEAFHADYSAGKAAFGGLMLSLKNELPRIAPLGRINTVAPGWVATPMAKIAMSQDGVIEQALATTPLKKIAQPEDVARQILILSSEAVSGHVTGETVMVHGGMEGRLLNPAESLRGVVPR